MRRKYSNKINCFGNSYLVNFKLCKLQEREQHNNNSPLKDKILVFGFETKNKRNV